MMTGYLDDSYNSKTVTVGGWIARDLVWDVIKDKWVERIGYEDRISTKRGLKHLTRYHASDCANLKGEFSGWGQGRQIQFVKRLIEIMTLHAKPSKPMAFAWGASLWEAAEIFRGASLQMMRRDMYKMCVYECLEVIGKTMCEYYSNEGVSFIHDSGSLFGPALEAFHLIKRHNPNPGVDQFIGFAPMEWRDCPLLQAADMVAYDSFRIINKRLHVDSESAARKSLRALVGKDTPIVVGYVKPGSFAQVVHQWLDEEEQMRGRNEIEPTT